MAKNIYCLCSSQQVYRYLHDFHLAKGILLVLEDTQKQHARQAKILFLPKSLVYATDLPLHAQLSGLANNKNQSTLSLDETEIEKNIQQNLPAQVTHNDPHLQVALSLASLQKKLQGQGFFPLEEKQINIYYNLALAAEEIKTLFKENSLDINWLPQSSSSSSSSSAPMQTWQQALFFDFLSLLRQASPASLAQLEKSQPEKAQLEKSLTSASANFSTASKKKPIIKYAAFSEALADAECSAIEEVYSLAEMAAIYAYRLLRYDIKKVEIEQEIRHYLDLKTYGLAESTVHVNFYPNEDSGKHVASQAGGLAAGSLVRFSIQLRWQGFSLCFAKTVGFRIQTETDSASIARYRRFQKNIQLFLDEKTCFQLFEPESSLSLFSQSLVAPSPYFTPLRSKQLREIKENTKQAAFSFLMLEKPPAPKLKTEINSHVSKNLHSFWLPYVQSLCLLRRKRKNWELLDKYGFQLLNFS